MALAADIPISYYRDDEEPFGFTLKDSAGVAIDISAGFAFTFTLNTEQDGDDPAATVLLTLAATITDGPNGKFQFQPAANDFDIAADTYFYDVQQDTPSKRTIVKSTFTILPQITLT